MTAPDYVALLDAGLTHAIERERLRFRRQPKPDRPVIQQWAEPYTNKGWPVLPIRPGTKAVDASKWKELVFKATDSPEGDQIGLLSLIGCVFLGLDTTEA